MTSTSDSNSHEFDSSKQKYSYSEDSISIKQAQLSLHNKLQTRTESLTHSGKPLPTLPKIREPRPLSVAMMREDKLLVHLTELEKREEEH